MNRVESKNNGSSDTWQFRPERLTQIILIFKVWMSEIFEHCVHWIAWDQRTNEVRIAETISLITLIRYGRSAFILNLLHCAWFDIDENSKNVCRLKHIHGKRFGQHLFIFPWFFVKLSSRWIDMHILDGLLAMYYIQLIDNMSKYIIGSKPINTQLITKAKVVWNSRIYSSWFAFDPYATNFPEFIFSLFVEIVLGFIFKYTWGYIESKPNEPFALKYVERFWEFCTEIRYKLVDSPK